MRTHILAIAVLIFSLPVSANEGSHQHGSKYAGQETREIKSLSSDDIAELQRGGGWGLAKAAELNGVPGPLHLLELKDEIPLSDGQVRQITDLYESMKARAIEQGEQLIARERELEDHFRKGTITEEVLRTSLQSIEDTRGSLRYTHLATHLQTPMILSDAQIARYNSLRGYGTADPCATVPEGHSAALWRKHNGCN